MDIKKDTLDRLTEAAKQSPRLRMNLDMRTTTDDNSQRMLNALEPGTNVPIHRHPLSTETVCVLRGRVRQTYYAEDGSKTAQEEIAAQSSCPFYCVPKGVWHKTEALEEGTVIFEAKDGIYGQDGSETLNPEGSQA